jgi:hypothetical protein
MPTRALENEADSSYNLTMRRVIFGCFVLAIAAFALYGFNAAQGSKLLAFIIDQAMPTIV